MNLIELRRKFGKLLAVLREQLCNGLPVELIVSDNASEDETPNVVKKYQELGLVDAPRLITVSRLVPKDYTEENARQIVRTFGQG